MRYSRTLQASAHIKDFFHQHLRLYEKTEGMSFKTHTTEQDPFHSLSFFQWPPLTRDLPFSSFRSSGVEVETFDYVRNSVCLPDP